MVERGNFSWYTMVWYDMVYHVVHGIPCGMFVPWYTTWYYHTQKTMVEHGNFFMVYHGMTMW